MGRMAWILYADTKDRARVDKDANTPSKMATDITLTLTRGGTSLLKLRKPQNEGGGERRSGDRQIDR